VEGEIEVPGWRAMVPLIQAHHVFLSYGPTRALKDVSLNVGPGRVLILKGMSGSGKTSLLYCLAGILRPSSGEVYFRDRPLAELSDDDLTRLRRDEFGFVFQFGDLVPELTILENVGLPLRLQGQSRKRASLAATELLERLGIAGVSGKRPAQTSGGQAQRAAVARALIHEPQVVFADEPTGALDSENRRAVLDELVHLAREAGSAIVCVTHEDEVAAVGDEVLVLKDGHLDGRSEGE
jgi:putative ABC transport system ATP-binding protein